MAVTIRQAAKVICSAKISSPGANGDAAPAVNQADFCPSDPAVVCVTGDRILRFFRVVDAQFKPLPLNLKMELQVYTAHCWLADEQVQCYPMFFCVYYLSRRMSSAMKSTTVICDVTHEYLRTGCIGYGKEGRGNGGGWRTRWEKTCLADDIREHASFSKAWLLCAIDSRYCPPSLFSAA